MSWKKQEFAEEAEFLGLLTRSTPRFFITPIIIALNMLIFAVMALSGVPLFAPEIRHLLIWGANFGPFTVNLEWWRLFSSTFLHIGLPHLVFNMWCLWSLGKLAERMFGNWTFLMLYVLSGLGGNIASLWWHPKFVSAGASGAIFGVAGGLITFLYLGKLHVPDTVIKRNLASILIFVGYNLFYGFQESGIDNAAHLGGLFIGLLMGALFNRPLPPLKTYSRLRYYLVFSGLALFLILGAGFAKRQLINDPFTKFIWAEKLMVIGKFDQAITEFQKALELEPDFTEAHYGLGRAYNNRGLAHGRKGQYDQAISDCSKAIEINPKDAAAYNNRGLAYQGKGQYDQAISDYSKAIEINPRFAVAYSNRGNAYQGKGQLDQAISDYSKAIEINPKFASAYRSRGYTYRKKGQYEKAISDYSKAIDINPKFASAYRSRGDAYDEKGQYEKAISDYTKAIEINREDASAQYDLGFRYLRGRGVTADADEAANLWRKAADQGNTSAQYGYGYLCTVGAGVSPSLGEAVKWYRKAAEQGEFWAQYALGSLYELGLGVARDEAEAMKWYARVAKQDKYATAFKSFLKPARAGEDDAQFFVGNMYRLGHGVQQHDTKALEWLRKAAEHGYIPAQFLLALMHEKGQGVPQDFEAALKWYRMAAERGISEAEEKLNLLERR